MMPSEYYMYNIYNYFKPTKNGFTPEQCNEFVEKIIASFKDKTEEYPTVVLVPSDYTGGGNAKTRIVSGGKPAGHYYATNSEV